jgi:hypothetical protein
MKRNKNNFLYSFIFSWVNLADALVCIILLGQYNPCWSIGYARWYAFRKFKK